MAKKKKKTHDEATVDEATVEAQTGGAPAKPAPRLTRKTYLMTDDLIRRVERQAQDAGVGINEMNRYLVALALELVESGQHEIRVTMVTQRTLGV